jgi:hypothetical protein
MGNMKSMNAFAGTRTSMRMRPFSAFSRLEMRTMSGTL